MGRVINILFSAVLVLLWIIAGGFVTQANVKLSDYKNNDPDLHRAYWSTFWAAFITWTLIGIFIILVILAVFGVIALFGSGVGEGATAAAAAAGETATTVSTIKKVAGSTGKSSGIVKKGSSWLIIACMIIALLLVTLTGILAAVAAANISQSDTADSSNPDISKAYYNCIIAASFCLGAVGLLIIGLIVWTISKEHKKSIKKREAEVEAQLSGTKPTAKAAK